MFSSESYWNYLMRFPRTLYWRYLTFTGEFFQTILFTIQDSILELISQNDNSYLNLTSISEPETSRFDERPSTSAFSTTVKFLVLIFMGMLEEFFVFSARIVLSRAWKVLE